MLCALVVRTDAENDTVMSFVVIGSNLTYVFDLSLSLSLVVAAIYEYIHSLLSSQIDSFSSPFL